MSKHVFSIFVAVAFVLSASTYAQVDMSGIGTVPENLVPLLFLTESTDGAGSDILETTTSSVKLPVPPLNGDAGPLDVGKPIGELVRMMEVDGNVEDGFKVQVDDEVFVWNSGIADALDLTQTQRDTIKNSFQGLLQQGHSNGSRLARVEDARQRIGELRETTNHVLNIEQRMNFAKMSFQLVGGLDSLSLNGQVLGYLELTPAQEEQLNAIVSAREAELVSLRRQFNFIRATPAEREVFDATNIECAKKYADQIKSVLTSEQRARAEKLTEEIPALKEKLGMSPEGLLTITRDSQQIEQQTQEQGLTPPVYAPGADSWRPGRPLPVPSRPSGGPRRFPR